MATLANLIAQFKREWRAGNNARVQLECHAGQAWLSLHLHVQHPPPHQDARPRRQPGPSRLRRRARRAALRAKANAETNTAEVAVAVAYADTDLSTEKDVDVNNVEGSNTEEVADITEKVIYHNTLWITFLQILLQLYKLSIMKPQSQFNPIQLYKLLNNIQFNWVLKQGLGLTVIKVVMFEMCFALTCNINLFSLSHHPTNANCVEKLSDPEEL